MTVLMHHHVPAGLDVAEVASIKLAVALVYLHIHMPSTILTVEDMHLAAHNHSSGLEWCETATAYYR